eukprot:COSAG01_NODE_48593_length_379_cov_3.557143_1_plen_59_part_10
MQLFATTPGVQFYTGNFLSAVSGKGGAKSVMDAVSPAALERVYSVVEPCVHSPNARLAM